MLRKDADGSRLGRTEITYRTRPYVCGAIGPWDDSIVGRLRHASPTSVREIRRSSESILFASSKPPQWRANGRHGYYWGAVAEGRVPASWQEAAEARLAAGLQINDNDAVLHSDALGLQEIYVRRIGNALYFSVRVESLLDLEDTPLHTDWTAWADILSITSPVGESTQFQEVRRLSAATAYRADHDGIRRLSFEPKWLSVEPDSRVRPETAVDVVAERLRSCRRTAITLSGGWDSRLLALLAVRNGCAPDAWTTSKDDGYDHDVEFARPVADALRLRHRVVIPGPEAWLENHQTVRRRLSFQTNHHTWMMPLIRVLHRRSDRFIDGLAGDVLFRGSTRAWPAVHEADPAAKRRLIWDGHDQKRLQRRHLFAPGVAGALEEMSRASFDLAVRRFDGHVDSGSLSHLHTRGARAISLSPQWLLAPEVEVQLPFIHPEVMQVALSVPLSRKFEDHFCREMMNVASPSVAALPSTNDGLRFGRTGNMRQRSPDALRSLAASILARDEVARLLSSEMRFALRDTNGLDLIGRTNAGSHLLQWAAMLADWRSTYASRLVDEGLDLKSG